METRSQIDNPLVLIHVPDKREIDVCSLKAREDSGSLVPGRESGIA